MIRRAIASLRRGVNALGSTDRSDAEDRQARARGSRDRSAGAVRHSREREGEDRGAEASRDGSEHAGEDRNADVLRGRDGRDGTDANEGAVIRLEGVSKSFGARKVLDDVSIDVAKGTAFCLLGRSGTGKSVTLKHIIGLMQPDSGRVFVHGQEVSQLKGQPLADVRRSMGFLFQNSALFDSITVGENVAFPLRRHTDWSDAKIREVATAKLADVGLENDFDKMPADLSGGMKKRAGLARAMALDPDILLVDEPSAGLDPITADEIDDLLVQLKRRGTTLVMVTHNIPSARHVGDELAFLHEGKVLARGGADALERSEHEMVRTFMRSEGAG